MDPVLGLTVRVVGLARADKAADVLANLSAQPSAQLTEKNTPLFVQVCDEPTKHCREASIGMSDGHLVIKGSLSKDEILTALVTFSLGAPSPIKADENAPETGLWLSGGDPSASKQVDDAEVRLKAKNEPAGK